MSEKEASAYIDDLIENREPYYPQYPLVVINAVDGSAINMALGY
jgi:hypothetical protein